MFSEKHEFLASEIVDAAYKVHKELGPGLLEKVYESCFCHELARKDIPYKRQVILPIHYKEELIIEEALKIDVLVDDLIICELKSVMEIQPIFTAQLLTYLRLSNLNLGFLINFNTMRVKDGIKRFAL